MSIDDPDAALRIAESGRLRALGRMQAAFDDQFRAASERGGVDAAPLALDVADAVERAGAAFWRISLAEGAAAEFGVTVGEALAHPALSTAEQIVDAPAERRPIGPERPDEDETAAAEPVPSSQTAETVAPTTEAGDEAAPTTNGGADAETETVPEPDALRLGAIHTSGIEALRAGEDDLELRLSRSGLDVLKRTSGAAIGRLEWSEIVAVEVQPLKRGLRGRPRGHTLQVETEHGQAVFALPDLSVQEADEHLRPTLQRFRGDPPAHG